VTAHCFALFFFIACLPLLYIHISKHCAVATVKAAADVVVVVLNERKRGENPLHRQKIG
jgi:hypothetical protein